MNIFEIAKQLTRLDVALMPVALTDAQRQRILTNYALGCARAAMDDPHAQDVPPPACLVRPPL